MVSKVLVFRLMSHVPEIEVGQADDRPHLVQCRGLVQQTPAGHPQAVWRRAHPALRCRVAPPFQRCLACRQWRRSCCWCA